MGSLGGPAAVLLRLPPRRGDRPQTSLIRTRPNPSWWYGAVVSEDAVDPTDLLSAEYERRLAELRAELAAATTWWQRFRLRRRMMQLQQRTFNRHIPQW